MKRALDVALAVGLIVAAVAVLPIAIVLSWVPLIFCKQDG